MSEKNETTEKSQKPEKTAAVKNKGQVFLFPNPGIAITADNREEAEKIYKQTLKENKESNNG
jgi:hypothetical protein